MDYRDTSCRGAISVETPAENELIVRRPLFSINTSDAIRWRLPATQIRQTLKL